MAQPADGAAPAAPAAAAAAAAGAAAAGGPPDLGSVTVDIPGPGGAYEPTRRGDHAEYCVVLREPGGGTTRVWHRYREFRSLLSAVRSRAPGVPKPPPRKWFGDPFNPSLLQARAAQLKSCIEAALRAPEVRTQPELRRSLEAFVGARELARRASAPPALANGGPAPGQEDEIVVGDIADGPVTHVRSGFGALGIARATPDAAGPGVSFDLRGSTLGGPEDSFVSCADDWDDVDDSAGNVVLVTRARAVQLRNFSIVLVAEPGIDDAAGSLGSAGGDTLRQGSPAGAAGPRSEGGTLPPASFGKRLSSAIAQESFVARPGAGGAGAHPRARGRARRPTFARRPTEKRLVSAKSPVCPDPLTREAPHRMMQAWDFLSAPPSREWLSSGGSLFACSAAPGNVLRDVERAIVATYCDLSTFADEQQENGVLPINMGNDAEVADHIFLLTKGMYLLPRGCNVKSFTPELFHDVEFQRAIAASGTKVHPKVRDRDGKVLTTQDTFCLSKEVIPWVFSVTTQYRVSVVPESRLAELTPLSEGLPLERALLLERTKQDRGQDATKRAKQLLLYHRLADGGVLVTHVAFSIFTSLPSVVRKVVDKIGTKGAAELSETVAKLRGHIAAGKLAG